MKKILTIAIAFAAISFSATAQTQRKTTASTSTSKMDNRHNRQAEMNKLNLSTAQKAQLKAQHQDAKAQMAALKAQGLSEDQMKAKRQELKKVQKAKTQSILTADQKAQLKKDRAAMKMNHGKKQGMKNRGMKMNKELGLNADQQNKMKALHQTTKQQMQAIKNDQSLTADARKAKMQDLKKTTMNSRKQILTKEQQEKAMQMHKENKMHKASKK